MLMSKNAKRKTVWFVAAFLLCGVLRNVFYRVDFTYAFSSLYCGVLVLLWAITVQERITDDRLRRLLVLVAASLLLHFFLQFYRYELSFGNVTAQRHLWYAYYIPMIAQPLLCYMIAVRIYRPEDKPLPKHCYLLLTVGGLLVLGMLTNDLHFWAISFPGGILDDNGQEVYGWLYYGAQGFLYGLYALAFATLVKKNLRYVARKYRWIPVIPLLIGAVYFLLYPLDIGHRLFVTRLWQMGEMFAFCIIATLETAVQVGMIPENRSYETLFSAAHLPAVILDSTKKVAYQTAEARYPFPQRADVKIVSHPIRGGSVEYLVDIRKVRDLNQQLAERSQQIETRNDYLAEEARIKKERAALETKARLYENISGIVSPQLNRIDELLNAPACGNRELARIAILTAYVKRRSNMELLSKGGMLTVLELFSAVQESLDYVQLLGVNTAVTTVGSGAYAAQMVADAYAHIEAVIENCMDTLSDLFITIRADKADLTVRVLLHADSFSYEAGSAENGVGFSRRVVITKEQPDLRILFTFTEGGGQV